MSSPANAQYSVEKILGSLFALLAFSALFGIGIKFIPIKPRVGWFATILFGTMCVVVVIDIVRNCSLDQDQIPKVKDQLSIRRVLVNTGAVIAAIFLGVAEHFISDSFSQPFSRLGVWLAAFMTTLAFYPLREEKEANFKLWVIFSALMGVASVVVSYLTEWLEAFLTA